MKKLFKLLPVILLFLFFGYTATNEDTTKVLIDKIFVEISEATNEENSKENITEENNTNTTVATENSSKYNGPYKVIRTVDGDTFIINLDGEETRVRMIGIDTPESVHSNEEKNTEEGKIASDYTKKLLTGKNVYLEFDVDKYDDYDRLLAYVYTEDKTMVNKLLIKEGYARMYTVQPNVKYKTDFYQMQMKAREEKAGFWDGFDQWQ